MKPHMRHIQETLAKKQAVEKAKDMAAQLAKYRAQVERAQRAGYSNDQIAAELENEVAAVMADDRTSDDPLYQQGVHNAKVACVTAIRVIIAELKGEENAQPNIQS